MSLNPYHTLSSQLHKIAHEVVSVQLAERRHDSGTSEKWYPYCLQDAKFHLSHMEQALTLGEVKLFCDYILWCKAMLHSYGVPTEDLKRQLQLFREIIPTCLDESVHEPTLDLINQSLAILEVETEHDSGVIPSSNQHAMNEKAEKYLHALLNLEPEAAWNIIEKSLHEGTSLQEIYLDFFQTSQREVGRLWQKNLISVAEEHYCSAVTNSFISRLSSHIPWNNKKRPRIILFCVQGESHDIGVRILSDLLELNGWDSHLLGANLPNRGLEKVIMQYAPNVVGISNTMTTHLSETYKAIKIIRNTQVTPQPKIIVGGQIFIDHQDLYRNVGADDFGIDAKDTLIKASNLLSTAQSI
ncbi:cobalamin B12-binding domain-containing protein [Magnetococcales bacterium HHB-1]